MTLDWEHFTPGLSLVGGVLIGAASALYLLGNGRIAGIAGILASPLRTILRGDSLGPERVRLLFLAGLLVGVGVRLGNGCTSGHGVCGLSRFSLRSLANVMAFMGAGVVTVFVLRHIF
jgi:uncharacterized membrane protein YedE/YeeE